MGFGKVMAKFSKLIFLKLKRNIPWNLIVNFINTRVTPAIDFSIHFIPGRLRNIPLPKGRKEEQGHVCL